MKQEFKTVALLPMKAHSERVQGKNFKEFAGKPLFQWILHSLLSTASIDAIVVNTDARANLESLGFADSDRLVIRERKPELCGDLVSMNLIIKDDIEAVVADTYVMTHATNPLLSRHTIRKAIETFQAAKSSGKCDSLFTVNRMQTRFYLADCSPVNHDPANLLRTQDLEPWFEENSNLYIFSRESFLSTDARIGSNPMLYETPRMESFDIDDKDGWDLAELVAKHLWYEYFGKPSSTKRSD